MAKAIFTKEQIEEIKKIVRTEVKGSTETSSKSAKSSVKEADVKKALKALDEDTLIEVAMSLDPKQKEKKLAKLSKAELIALILTLTSDYPEILSAISSVSEDEDEDDDDEDDEDEEDEDEDEDEDDEDEDEDYEEMSLKDLQALVVARKLVKKAKASSMKKKALVEMLEEDDEA